MQLELKDEKGVIGTIHLPVEELKKILGLDSVLALPYRFSNMEAKLAELEEDEVAKLTPEEQAEEALVMTHRVLSGVGDETAQQIITECGKEHLLQSVSDVLKNLEIRTGNSGEEGWTYHPFFGFESRPR